MISIEFVRDVKDYAVLHWPSQHALWLERGGIDTPSQRVRIAFKLIWRFLYSITGPGFWKAIGSGYDAD